MDSYPDLQRRIAERSPDALYEIKKLLRSRCTDQQMLAVKTLEACLRAEHLTSRCPLRDFMLEEDIVGFLCDAMTTNSWPLLQRLTSSLELLSDSNKMLLEGHAVLAAEASQRRVHFLGLMVGSSADCEPALRDVLGLLTTLLFRWGSVIKQQGGSSASAPVGVSGLCPATGMLSTLSLVLTAKLKGTATTATAMCAVQTLCALLRHTVVGVEPGNPSSLAASIARCARAAMASLERVLDEPGEELWKEGDDDGELPDREMACELLCSLSAQIVGARAACERTLGTEDDALLVLLSLEKEALDALLEKCLPLVVRVATASAKDYMELDLDTSRDCDLPPSGSCSGLSAAMGLGDEIDDGLPALVGVLLDALQSNLSHGKDPIALADQLVCRDFLWLLPALHRVDPSNGASLRLTFLVLAHLAHDLLDAGTWWEGGAENMAAFLHTGAHLLSKRNHEWPIILEQWPYTAPRSSASPPAAAQLIVLLLNYFRSLAGGNCEQMEIVSLSKCLPPYILSLPARPPLNVLKMTWLSYAVQCQLTTEEVSARSRAAGARLALLLEQSECLDSAYTHHPAVLFWAFKARSAVPPRLQKMVAELWLLDGDVPSNTTPMLELVVSHSATVHPLLDVVTDGHPEVVQRAAHLLAKAASSSPAVADDLSTGLWARLPIVLSSSRPGRVRDDGDDCCGLLVWLAAQVFRPPPADMALRVASLLGGALGRQRLGAEPRTVSAAMSILLQLLEDARRRSDPRVHRTLLSDARFARALLSAALYKNDRACITALTLLRVLEQDRALLKVPVVLESCTLEMGTILVVVNSANIQVFEAGLMLLQEVLRPKEHKFLILEENDSLLRTVYFVLQSKVVKFKDVFTLGDTVWSVLKDLLSQSEMVVHQPWNHVLICYNLRLKPLQEASVEFLLFLLRWLRLIAPAEPPKPTPRRAMPSKLTETCAEIATALVTSDTDFRDSSVARDIGKALLKVTANLPTGLQKSLEEIASSL